MPHSTPEARAAYQRELRRRAKENPLPRTKECATEGCTKMALARRTKCSACKMRDWRAKNPDYAKSYQAMRHEEARAAAIKLYGGECQCCGVKHTVFLTFDHVQNDGGGRMRKQGSRALALDAIKRHGDGYYELSCFNCNSGRYINGGVCPHITNRARH